MGACRFCHRAQSVDEKKKIIQHELLMSWIIARFHGYGPAECGPALRVEMGREREKRGDGEIKKQPRNTGWKLCTAGSVTDAIAKGCRSRIAALAQLQKRRCSFAPPFPHHMLVFFASPAENIL